MPVCFNSCQLYDLTSWDLVQSVKERKLRNFMIFANNSNLKIVNSGHPQALVRKVNEYLMSIRISSTVCMPNLRLLG